jgi:hypothetical protein
MRANQLSVWDDTQIKAGDIWRDAIRRALASAKVAVLLVSMDFYNSDFIVNNELPPLLEAAQKEGLKILLVIVGHSLFDETELGRYQAVNDPLKPLATMTAASREKEIVKICRKIKAAMAPEAPEASVPVNQISSDVVSVGERGVPLVSMPERDNTPTNGFFPALLSRLRSAFKSLTVAWIAFVLMFLLVVILIVSLVIKNGAIADLSKIKGDLISEVTKKNGDLSDLAETNRTISNELSKNLASKNIDPFHLKGSTYKYTTDFQGKDPLYAELTGHNVFFDFDGHSYQMTGFRTGSLTVNQKNEGQLKPTPYPHEIPIEISRVSYDYPDRGLPKIYFYFDVKDGNGSKGFAELTVDLRDKSKMIGFVYYLHGDPSSNNAIWNIATIIFERQ